MARPKTETVTKQRSAKYFDPKRDLRNDVMGHESRTGNYGSRPAKPNYCKLVIKK